MKRKTLKEARWILGILLALWLLSFLILPLFLLPVTAAIGFTLFFFRDPERHTPTEPGLIVSPADGTVVAIEEVQESEFFHTKTKRISIFLSIFDVHVNRSPLEATITRSETKKGGFCDARDPRSSQSNQSRTWLFSDGKIEVAVRQITGAIARRIVGWSQVGDQLQRGERFGMIRFGSRTELYLPLHVEITVQIGAHVKGAESVLARIPQG